MTRTISITVLRFQWLTNEGSLLTVGVGPFEINLFHTEVNDE